MILFNNKSDLYHIVVQITFYILCSMVYLSPDYLILQGHRRSNHLCVLGNSAVFHFVRVNFIYSQICRCLFVRFYGGVIHTSSSE